MPSSAPRNLLVVQPSWVGDAVMAGPALRAIRNLYPDAKISYLMKRYVKPIYTGMPWADRLITYRTGKTKAKAGKGQFFELAARRDHPDFPDYSDFLLAKRAGRLCFLRFPGFAGFHLHPRLVRPGAHDLDFS